MTQKVPIDSPINNADPDPSTHRTIRAIHRTLVLIAFMLAANVLYFGRDLIMPLVLGLLLAMTLSPVVRSLSRFKIPAPVVSFLMVGIAGLLVVLGTYSLSDSLSELVESAPQVKEKIEQRLLDYKEPIETAKQASGQLEELVESINNKNVSTVAVEQPNLITTAASTFATSATTLGIALFMALFLLATGTLFHEKLLDLMPGLAEKKQALKIVYAIENKVSSYLLTITMINAGLGAVIALLMYLLNVPNPMVWGVAAMFLNFLPFVGAIIGAVAVGLVSLTTFDSIGPALLAPLLYYVCSLIEGSFLTPLIIGHRMSLNIVAVFLSVTIWGWLWGIPGVLMAVPILVAVKVVCDHVRGWAAFGHFLTGRIPWDPGKGRG
ncbi:MAG: AI-2E family transporter [Granulosicoccus sp.]